MAKPTATARKRRATAAGRVRSPITFLPSQQFEIRHRELHHGPQANGERGGPTGLPYGTRHATIRPIVTNVSGTG